MPSYSRKYYDPDDRDIEYLRTSIIDIIGIGLISGRIEVYCDLEFSEINETDTRSAYAVFAIHDPENYIGKTRIRMDAPEYVLEGYDFSFSADIRKEFIRLLTEPQFYGMTGWEFALRSIDHECKMRGIDYIPYDLPDYSMLPVKEDGFRTRTEKLYCENLNEHMSIEADPMFEIEEGLYVVAFPIDAHLAEGFYFKIIKVDMSDPEEWFEEKDILAWCRISMESLRYIKGYDECLILSDEQVNKLIRLFGEEIDTITPGIKETKWQALINLYANDYKITGSDISFDNHMPMPDYSKLKEQCLKDSGNKDALDRGGANG